MAPTTAMASRALVSDISGVWSKGETRRITSNPMKAASMKTNRPLISVELILPPPEGISRCRILDAGEL